LWTSAPTEEVRALVSPAMLPQLAITSQQLRDLPIEPRAAFLLSLVDGQCSVGMIADIAGMSGDDAIAIFAMLIQFGAVELRDPR
jgi:proline racemase